MLYDLSRQIPQLKKDIQDGLLKMLSLVLMHKPLRHPGMPKGLAHQLASPSLTNIPEASDVGSITLALRTLGSFEFEGKNQKDLILLVTKYTFVIFIFHVVPFVLDKKPNPLQEMCQSQYCIGIGDPTALIDLLIQ